MRSSYLGGQNSCVSIEKCETKISLNKRSSSSFFRHTQLLLTLAWTSAAHKVQGLSLGKGVIDLDLQKQKSFLPGQKYATLSRIKTYGNLYCIVEFKKFAIKGNKDTLL